MPVDDVGTDLPRDLPHFLQPEEGPQRPWDGPVNADVMHNDAGDRMCWRRIGRRKVDLMA